ncbi:MAG: glycosyltransferase, partial [Sulfitobacter sp.]
MSLYDDGFGSLLVALGLLTAEQLSEALRLSDEWGTPLQQVLSARNWVSTRNVTLALGTYYKMPVVDLVADPADPDLIAAQDASKMRHYQTIPIGRDAKGRLRVATASPTPQTIIHIAKAYGDVDLVLAQPFDIDWSLQRVFRDHESHEAVFALVERDPEMSARTVATTPQLVLIYVIASVILLGLGFAPVATLIWLNAIFTVFYLGNFIFKAVLVWAGGEAQID